jgi:2'-5' RNA ligase
MSMTANEILDQHSNGTFVALWLSDESSKKLVEWCDAHQISHQSAEEFHCTLCYSHNPIPQAEELSGPILVTARIKGWENLGENATVILLESSKLQDLHNLLRKHGASHDYDSYTPHVTINPHSHSNPLPTDLPDFDLTFHKIIVKPIREY